MAFEITEFQPATCYEVPAGTVPWASWKPEVSSAEALAHSEGLIIRRWEDEKCEGTDANMNTPYDRKSLPSATRHWLISDVECSFLQGSDEHLPKAVSFDWKGDEQPIQAAEEPPVQAAPLRNPDPPAIESSSVQTTSAPATTSQPPSVRTTTNDKTVYKTVALRTEYVTGLPGKRRMRF